MNSTQDLINEKNYVLREIKEIKGINNINQENFEMIDDFTEIHEIKDIKKKQIQPKKYFNTQNYNLNIEIKLEGEQIPKKTKQNSLENTNEQKNIYKENKIDDLSHECKDENLCPDCRGETLCPECRVENLCPECKGETLCPECKGENLCPECKGKETEFNKEILCDECKKEKVNEINEEDKCVKFGIVEAPFLENKNEDNLESDNINNLMEAIFDLLKSDDILKDFDNLKITFKALKENDKNEIIEGIKIKIENEEQEKRFNNLLKYLI